MTKKDENTTVAPVGNENLPSFLKDAPPVAVSGTEDMSEDFATPRIQLAQAMSPQVKKKDPEHIEGLDEGDFFHALHKTAMGDSFEAVILKIFDSRTLFDDDNAVDCYSSDTVHGSKHEEKCADCPLKDWVDGEPPACKMFQNHIIVTDDGEAAIISTRKSNKHATQAAREIKTQAKLCERAGHGLYAYKFLFESKMVKNGAGQSFYVLTAKPAGFIESEEKYESMKKMAEQFADYNKMGANNSTGGDDDGGE